MGKNKKKGRGDKKKKNMKKVTLLSHVFCILEYYLMFQHAFFLLKMLFLYSFLKIEY